MVNAIDLSTRLTATTAANLARNGIVLVGRYLYNGWKGLTPDEIKAIKGAGIDIFSIYENGGSKAAYFTAANGQAAANEAYTIAKSLGQPEETAIYFTVDFDAQAKDLPNILAYFQAVKASLKGYKVGIYGKYDVLSFMQPKGIAEYYFQTVAWSHGQHCNFNNLFQFQCDKTDKSLGLNVDYVNMEKSDVGAWGQKQQKSFVMTVKVLQTTDVRSTPSHSGGFIKNAQPDERYNVIQIVNDWHEVALDDSHKGWIDGNGGKNLYWEDNPALKAAAPQPVYHTVISGDTVGKLASQNGTTISQIAAWNNLDDADSIYIGQKLRVK